MGKGKLRSIANLVYCLDRNDSMKGLKLARIFFFITVIVLVIIFSGTFYKQQLSVASEIPGRNYMSLEKSVTAAVNTTGDCEVHRYKSWKEGVVTTLTPTVGRNCTRLFAGEEGEIEKVKSQLTHWNNTVSDEDILEKTRNCSWVQSYLIDNLYTTELERSFPIAFTYVVYNSPQQILRLFRVHYRQHNVYCIHPDKKSSKIFSGIFQNIAACLDNVIIPKTLVSVTRWTEEIMSALMICLEELMQFRVQQAESNKWKYVINLCGKELPLTTTHGIIEHLTKLNGSSSIRASKMTRSVKRERLGLKKIPFGLAGYKSMTYMALSHQFANFLLTNQTAIQLYKFFSTCKAPEEHFFATVFMIPGVPGGFNPKLSRAYFTTGKSFWVMGKSRPSCGGMIVHYICVVSVAELKEILEKSEGGKQYLFHNKYFMEMDHVVMDCMEERIVARNKMEYKFDHCKK